MEIMALTKDIFAVNISILAFKEMGVREIEI